MLTSKIFENDFKTFSSVVVLVHAYDHKFETIDQLSELLNHDFTGHFKVAGMNIKNFYEASKDEIEIEAVNRFLLFWMRLNEKVLHKKIGHSDK